MTLRLPTSGFIAGICLLAQLQGISPSTYAATITSSIERTIQRRVDFGYNPGIVIGIVDENGRDFYGYGETTLETNETPNEHTLYEIGSISKVFTATLLAQMVENGDLEYSNTVGSLLPQEVSVPTRQQRAITLEHLATHASGLLNNPPSLVHNSPDNPFSPYPPEKLYAFLNGYQLTRTPGSEYEYSNLGMGLLGHALSLQAGSSYEEALTERLLKPLGLLDTTLTPSPDQRLRRAQGYNGVVARPEFIMDSLAGAGQILSTVDDMLAFLEYQLGLQQTSLSPVLDATQERRFSTGSPGQDMGLGWIITQAGSDTLRFHDGATIGHNSFAGFSTRLQKGVVVFSNARINQYSSVQDLGLKALIPEYPLNPIRRPFTVPESQLANYVGLYQDADGNAFQVEERHQQLTVTYSEDLGIGFTIYPTGADLFQLYELGITASARFVRSDDNQVITGMEWTQGDTTTLYTRSTEAPSLTIAATARGIELIVSGANGDSATIEHSSDLVNWLPLETLIIGSTPILVPSSETEQQFFRIQE